MAPAGPGLLRHPLRDLLLRLRAGMTRSPTDLQLAIEALRPDLDAFAARLSPDPGEAARLVSLVITAASDEASLEERSGDLRPWLFGLMRAAFHSEERRRRL